MVALIARAIAAVLDHHPLPTDASNRILARIFRRFFYKSQINPRSTHKAGADFGPMVTCDRRHRGRKSLSLHLATPKISPTSYGLNTL
jgi:hypothetical protein